MGSKISCDMVKVASLSEMHNAPAGAYFIGDVKDGEHCYKQFWINLPYDWNDPDGTKGGCQLHGLPLRPAYTQRPSWEWDGNEDCPTLTPSILAHRRDDGKNSEAWHGFITKGRLVSC